MLRSWAIIYFWAFLILKVQSKTTPDAAKIDNVTVKPEAPTDKFAFDIVDCEVQCDNGFCLVRNTSVCHCFGLGPNCEEDCPRNTWGLNCKNNCTCTADNQICNKLNGNCVEMKVEGKFETTNCNVPCKFGICPVANASTCICFGQGVNCDKECPMNKWGVNCMNDCNCEAQQKCNHINGNCLMKKETISIAPKEPESNFSFLTFLLYFIAAGIIAGLVYIYYRKKTRLQRACQRSRSRRRASVDDTPKQAVALHVRPDLVTVDDASENFLPINNELVKEDHYL